MTNLPKKSRFRSSAAATLFWLMLLALGIAVVIWIGGWVDFVIEIAVTLLLAILIPPLIIVAFFLPLFVYQFITERNFARAWDQSRETSRRLFLALLKLFIS